MCHLRFQMRCLLEKAKKASVFTQPDARAKALNEGFPQVVPDILNLLHTLQSHRTSFFSTICSGLTFFVDEANM